MPPPPQMSVLSRQVTSVSQELQEMTRLLKPLFHNSSLLIPCAVTPPPSVTPPLQTQQADASSPPPVLVLDLRPPQLRVSESLRGSPPPPPGASRQLSPPPSHRSAPPSLHSSPHERSRPCPAPSSPPSSTAPLLLDLSEPEPQLQVPSYPRPLLRPPGGASVTTLRDAEWKDSSSQVSFVDEGRPSV